MEIDKINMIDLNYIEEYMNLLLQKIIMEKETPV